MTQKDRDLLRSTFNQDAERYDRARPGYPAALFDDLAELTSIGAGSRVLEIGPGTGQATRPLAERGCRVVAVELGADLAALARRNLAGFPSVDVVNAAFEAWPLPAEPFDLVLAATAFRWTTRPCASTRSPTLSDRTASSRPSAPITSPAVTSRSSPRSRTATCAGIPTPRPPWRPGDRHPQRPLRPRRVRPVRAGDDPPLRMGLAVLDRRLRRPSPHLLRTPRPRPRSPAQPARLHRQADRHRLRRPDHQALPDRTAGGSDHRPSAHGSGVIGQPHHPVPFGPSPPARRAGPR